MATRPWFYLINPFIVATRDSYSGMKEIGDNMLAAIAAKVPPLNVANAAVQPEAEFFAELLAEAEPAVQNFNEKFIVWENQQGTVKGQTKSLSLLLEDLSSTNAAAWDRAIQNVYLPGTGRYIQLLPRHRQPFQQGSQQDKISAVGTLLLAIGDDAALQTLKTQVNSFYTALVNANNTQKGSKSTKSGSSAAVEAARIALCIVLYGILGRLIHYYKETPDVIATIVPVDALRNLQQMLFNQEIDGGETKLVFTRTLETGDKIKCTNRGNTVLQLALVQEKNDPMPAEAFTLQPNEEELVKPDVLGAAGNRFLIIKNMSATEKGAFTIEII